MQRAACLVLTLAACGQAHTVVVQPPDASATRDLTDPFPAEDLASTAEDDLTTACLEGATVIGKVLAPNGLDPVPFAKIYVPDGPVAPLPTTVSCDQCNRVPPSLASTTALFDGTFTLTGVPAGDRVPIVIQLGRFRRITHIQVAPCGTASLPMNFGRLPAKDGETDASDRVPHFAVASGDYDQIECVLRRMGLQQIDLYDDRGGQNVPPTIGKFEALLTNFNKLSTYDVVVVNCTENQFNSLVAQPAIRDNLTRYAALGGRIYATDWGYDFIEQVPAFSPYLCFEPQRGGELMCGPDPQTVNNGDSNDPYSSMADIVNPKLAKWLALFPGVINKMMQVPIDFSFVVIDQVAADIKKYPTSTWVKGDTGRFGVKPLTVTFDYQGCGRVHYSTFNTEPNGVVPDNERYPNCKANFSPQERILEYLVFEITGCIDPSH